MKKIMVILSLLFITVVSYSETKDYSSAISNAVKNADGALTPAVVAALVKDAAKDGAGAEAAMVKQIMAAYSAQAGMIASTALGSCSDAAVVGVANVIVANPNVPSTSYQNLYNTAVSNNAAAASQLAVIFGISIGGGGGLDTNQNPHLSTIITGQNNNKDENNASE